MNEAPRHVESFVRGLPDVETRKVVGAGGAGSAVAHALLPDPERMLRHFAELAEADSAAVASAPLLARPRASLDSNTEERP